MNRFPATLTTVLTAALMVTALALPRSAQGDDGHGHPVVNPSHGGTIIEVGHRTAHLELIHNAKTGEVTIHVSDGNGKAEMGLADAIRINVSSKDKKTQVVMRALNLKGGQASLFDAEDPVLKTGHLEGKISLRIGGKKFSVEIPHADGGDGHGDDDGHNH